MALFERKATTEFSAVAKIGWSELQPARVKLQTDVNFHNNV